MAANTMSTTARIGKYAGGILKHVEKLLAKFWIMQKNFLVGVMKTCNVKFLVLRDSKVMPCIK